MKSEEFGLWEYFHSKDKLFKGDFAFNLERKERVEFALEAISCHTGVPGTNLSIGILRCFIESLKVL